MSYLDFRLEGKVDINCSLLAFFAGKQGCLLRPLHEDSSNEEKIYLACICADYSKCRIYLKYRKQKKK